MRKIGFLFLVFAVIIFAAFMYRLRIDGVQKISKTSIQEDVDISVSSKENYIFIPYWTVDSAIADAPFNSLIYFGVDASVKGVDSAEDGYKKLNTFHEFSKGKKTLLTVRMLDPEENSDILKNKKIQNQIISESIIIAKEYGFSGIILDLEMKGLPFDSLINRITDFNKSFYENSKREDLSFSTLIYGDVYYRIRPYDVKKLSIYADRIFVMSYDFSKSNGNPGPNFPLEGKDIYGYDFKIMVSDFKKEVPSSKLTFIFGMFGYDWPIDKNGKSTGPGVAKTTLQAERMIAGCVAEDTCSVSLDKSSQETKVTYQKEGSERVLWFETSHSTDKKITYLKSVGLESVGWWAYSYF